MRHWLAACWVTSILLLLVTISIGGCARSKYRLEADQEVYGAIAQRNGDPRWNAPQYTVEIDPRSRFYDPYDPDSPPMPRDDPAAFRYMQCVDGMEGWDHWLDNGVRLELENPGWKESLGQYVEVDEEGVVKLDVDSALKLAYIHSPNHQSQLETLYLSALDVTAERFRFDTQYFGGYDVTYTHNGSLVPAALTFDPGTGRYVVSPPFRGAESNRLTVGRPSAANPALDFRRQFATAGQLLAGFANSFVFEFNGADANLSASLLNFTFLQPLLRGAGRDVALEQLTFLERALLANLRSYGQFRQGFYTQVAIGELGVSGPQRGGARTNLQVFSGRAGLGGYVGLLQQLQQIRNSEDNLNLQLRTLARLESLLDAGLIDLVQVDQFRQSVERQRADLLQSRNDYLLALDGYKTDTLGLPPNLPVEVDDDLIRQFQLVDRKATGVQEAINQLQDQLGLLPEEFEVESLAEIQQAAFALIDSLRVQLDSAITDLDQMREMIPVRIEEMDDTAASQFAREVEQLERAKSDLQQQYTQIETQLAQLLQSGGGEEGLNQTVVLLRDMLRLVQGAILVQARSRLESVTIESVVLQSEDAFEIALANRLDFMNGRAALVDSWRLIQVNADALQSVLNVSASGDVRTARNNPLSLRGATSNLQLGLQFDAPLTRLIERNAYRESLINYQRNRRAYIQSRDSLHFGLRVLLRQIEQLRTNLEIQRRAVAIAIRRVDLTRAALDEPVPPPQPGQRAAQFGPTAAINLLSAQSALQDTQNAFLGVWLNYYAAQMRLARELGLMELDSEGRWIQTPLASPIDPAASGLTDPGPTMLATEVQDRTNQSLGKDANSSTLPSDPTEDLPPPLPGGLLETVERLPQDFTFQAPLNLPASPDSLVKEAALIE